jgi:predicted enzyme related to lactoylglutathione lyase
MEEIRLMATSSEAVPGPQGESVGPAIPGVGWLAYMKDTESNIFGLMQRNPTAA